MSPAPQTLQKTTTEPVRHDSVLLNNNVITAMLGCALSAIDGLNKMEVDVVSVSILGSRPVIDVSAGRATHRFTLHNSSDWHTHMGVCPVSKRRFIQVFVIYRECLVTWIKWER